MTGAALAGIATISRLARKGSVVIAENAARHSRHQRPSHRQLLESAIGAAKGGSATTRCRARRDCLVITTFAWSLARGVVTLHVLGDVKVGIVTAVLLVKAAYLALRMSVQNLEMETPLTAPGDAKGGIVMAIVHARKDFLASATSAKMMEREMVMEIPQAALGDALVGSARPASPASLGSHVLAASATYREAPQGVGHQTANGDAMAGNVVPNSLAKMVMFVRKEGVRNATTITPQRNQVQR